MFKKSNLYGLILLLMIAGLTDCRKLIMIHEIFRHGARYPIHNVAVQWPGNGDSNEGLLGELTLQGKHQHYILGKIMYDKYWEQLFAGTKYINKYHPSQIYLRSTNVNRTIQSLEAHMLGMLEKLPPPILPINQLNNSLPPIVGAEDYQQTGQNMTQFKVYGEINSDFHAIPIHQSRASSFSNGPDQEFTANPYDEGDFLAKYSESNCPNQRLWGKESMTSPQAMQIKRNKQVIAFLEGLSAAVGEKVAYEQAYIYIDNYYCAKYLGVQPLSFFKDPLQQRIANFIETTSTIFTFFFNQDQIKTSNTRLLQNIVYNMKQAIINKGPKIVIYSAHDTTLMSLHAALNFTNIHCLLENFLGGVNNSDTCILTYPPFASNIVIELWEEDDFSHSISILYNGALKKIPVCGYQTSCKFVDFQNWAKQFYIEDPNDTCGISTHYQKLYIVIAILSILTAILIVLHFRHKWSAKKDPPTTQMQQKKGYIENFQEKDVHFSNEQAQAEP